MGNPKSEIRNSKDLVPLSRDELSLEHSHRSLAADLIGIFLAMFLASALPLSAAPAPAAVKLVPMVRVNATNQAWDYFHPWTKHAPY